MPITDGSDPQPSTNRSSTIRWWSLASSSVEVFTTELVSLQMGASEQEARLELISRHRSLLRQMGMEEQVNQIVEQLIIPKEWQELILAYYLNDKGMSEFELRSFNLRQELTRQRELFKRGHITQAEYEQAFLFIDRQLILRSHGLCQKRGRSPSCSEISARSGCK